MRIDAYAAASACAALAPFVYEAAELGASDVEIEISHCGLCHSDIHLVDNSWSSSLYPLVPGHEIVGTVTAIGSAVTTLAPGQRVGTGWQRSSCLGCEYCLRGQENLCAAQTATCVGHHGGFATRIRTDGRFVFALPETLLSACAAPLLCGGVTVYAPLRRFGIGARHSVGVIGIGGLGHMALLVLRALGCEITAFSSTTGKRDEALRMGAHHFVSSVEPREIRKRAGSLDLLLSTVNVRLDWVTFLETLKPNGILCFVGTPPGLLQLPAAQLLTKQRSICGSDIGGRATIVEFLQFAARHRLSPEVQLAPMAEVNSAIDRVRRNLVRYRMVLSN